MLKPLTPAHPTQREHRGFQHSVGLDMVRAIAVLMVLTSHCGSIFSGWLGWKMPAELEVLGFYGVELFFVLSGFLIGRLLIGLLRRDPGMRDWLIFMVRRWLRTLPLYYVWLTVLVLVWRPRFWEPGLAALRYDLPWFLTMTQNLAWRQVDGWFGVSWSLGVEEWFYLVFSAALLGLAALLGRRAALPVALLLFIAGPLVLRSLVPGHVDWDEVTSKVVLLRLDAIATGVLVAWLVMSVRLARSWLWVLLALGVSETAFVWAGGLQHVLGMPQHIWHAVLFDFVSVGFGLCLPAMSQLTRTWPGIDYVSGVLSRQSYSLYITHLSLLEIIDYYNKQYDLSPALGLCVFFSSLVLVSYVLCRFVERPIIRMRPLQE